MAHNAGAFGILVLSGETTQEMIDRSTERPDLIVKDIGMLGLILENSKKIIR
jgi:NagD protein